MVHRDNETCNLQAHVNERQQDPNEYDLDTIKSLVYKGADIDCIQSQDEPLICVLADKCTLKMFSQLVPLVANKNVTNSQGETPLMTSVRKNQWAFCYYLIQEGCDINYPGPNGTALDIAVQCDNLELIPKLVLHGAKCSHNQLASFLHAIKKEKKFVNVIQHLVDADSVTSEGDCGLHVACKHGKFDTLNKILPKLKDCINKRGQSGNTSIHVATLYGQQGCLEALLQQDDIDICAKNDDLETALQIACKNQMASLIDLILNSSKSTQKTKSKQQFTDLLISACVNQQLGCVSVLLKHGANPSENNQQGSTAIHEACKLNNPQILKTLLKNVTLLRCKNHQGYTPLLLACKLGKSACIEAILEHHQPKPKNADYPKQNSSDRSHIQNLDNQKTSKGNGPLHLAVQSGDINCVQLFVKRFPSQLNEINNERETPLFIACRDQYQDIYDVLHQRMDVEGLNRVNVQGDRVFDVALRVNNSYCVKHMIRQNYQYDINTKCTLLMNLSTRGAADSIQVLLGALKEATSDVDFKAQNSGWGAISLIDYIFKTDEKKQTAFHKAAINGHFKCIQVIFQFVKTQKCEQTINCQVSDDWDNCDILDQSNTPSIDAQHHDVSGYDSSYPEFSKFKNARTWNQLLSTEDEDKFTLVDHAVVNGHALVVEALLNQMSNEQKQASEINPTDQKNIPQINKIQVQAWKLIILAIVYQRPMVLKVLAKRQPLQCLLSAEDIHQVEPVLRLRDHKKFNMYKNIALQVHQAQITVSAMEWAILLSAVYGDYHCMKVLLGGGGSITYSVNQKDTSKEQQTKIKKIIIQLAFQYVMQGKNEGYIMVADTLVNHGASAAAQMEQWSVAMACALAGNVQELDMCLQANIDIKPEAKNEGMSTLHVAIKSGSLEIVRRLYEQRGQRGLYDDLGVGDCRLSALFYSITENKTQIFYYFASKLDQSQISQQDKDGRTALMLAAGQTQGCYLKVKHLLVKGARPQIKDMNQNSALHFCCRSGQTEVIRLLYSLDSYYQPNRESKLPIQLAVDNDHFEAVCELLSLLPQGKLEEQKSEILIYGIKNGLTEFVTKLIQNVLHLDYVMAGAKTSLQLAVEYDQPELCQAILRLAKNQHQIDLIKKSDQNGQNCYQIACELGFSRIVEVFQDAGVDRLTLGQQGESALMVAAKYGHIEHIERLILLKTVCLKEMDLQQRTAYQYAALNNQYFAAKLLSDYGAVDLFRPTLLIAAAANRSEIVCQKLKESQIIDEIRNMRDQDGYNIVHCAARNNAVDVLKNLLETSRDLAVALAKDVTTNGSLDAIMIAAKYENLESLCCLQANYDISFGEDGQLGALHVAAQYGKVESLKCMIKQFKEQDKSNNINNQDNNGLTPLMHAIKGKNKVAISTLLNAERVNLCLSDKSSNTALHYAIELQFLEEALNIIYYLVEANNYQSILQSNRDGDTVLSIAIEKHMNDIVICIFEQVPDFLLNELFLYKETVQNNLQQLASKYGNSEVLEIILCELKAPSQDSAKVALQPIYLAAKNQHEDCIILLLKYGAVYSVSQKMNGVNLKTPQQMYSQSCIVGSEQPSSQPFQYFATNQIQQNRTNNQITPIMVLVQDQQMKVDDLQCMLDLGCNCNANDSTGFTALHYAAKHGNHRAISCLYKYRANIDAYDERGQTACMVACQYGQLDCLLLLLFLGANPDKQSRNGMTTVHYACLHNQPDILKTLIDHRANIEIKDQKGRSPLLVAAAKGSVACICELSSVAANKDARDMYGDNIWTTAIYGLDSGVVGDCFLDSWQAPGSFSSLNVKGYKGRCPLMVATLTKSTQWIRAIKNLVSETEIYMCQDAYGNNIAHIQCCVGHTQLDCPTEQYFKENNDKVSIIYIAIMSDNLQILKQILNKVSNSDTQGIFKGNKLFQLSVDYQSAQCFKYLAGMEQYQTQLTYIFKYMYSINLLQMLKHLPTKARSQALYIACRVGCCDAIQKLHELGVDINKGDDWGSKPLQLCILSKNVKCVQLLVNVNASLQGADITAIEQQQPEALKIILSKRNSPTIQVNRSTYYKNDSTSLLQVCIDYNDPECFKVVLQAGGNPIKQAGSHNAITYAASHGKDKLIQIINDQLQQYALDIALGLQQTAYQNALGFCYSQECQQLIQKHLNWIESKLLSNAGQQNSYSGQYQGSMQRNSQTYASVCYQGHSQQIGHQGSAQTNYGTELQPPCYVQQDQQGTRQSRAQYMQSSSQVQACIGGGMQQQPQHDGFGHTNNIQNTRQSFRESVRNPIDYTSITSTSGTCLYNQGSEGQNSMRGGKPLSPKQEDVGHSDKSKRIRKSYRLQYRESNDSRISASTSSTGRHIEARQAPLGNQYGTQEQMIDQRYGPRERNVNGTTANQKGKEQATSTYVRNKIPWI